MNIRKVLAGSMAAIAAGATIAFGAFAQSTTLGDYVGGTSSSPVPPWIVIGPSNGNLQYHNDVIGAANLAAGVAGHVTTSQAVGGAAEVAVSGGTSLSTANTKLFGGDAINKAKGTLTSDDLTTILASGTFEDDDGSTYDYDQYIVVGGSVIALSDSSDDDILGDDPAVLIDIGTAYSSPAYTMKVIFNDDLNFSDSAVDGNTIVLFGTEYTISSDSDTDTLVLFGGSNKQTLSEGETATVDVGGVSYEVSVIGVSDENTVVVKVNDVSRTIDEGNSRKVSGLEVYVDEVYYLGKESQTSSARLSFGSSKLTISDNDEVSVGSGSEEEDIDNTHVTIMQGTDGASVLKIAVAAPDSDGDFAAVGMPFTDPVFGTFKLAFGGSSPALADMELFEFDTSGDDTATVKFTDTKGNERTIEWAYDSSKAVTDNVLTLADGDDDKIKVLEGATANEDDYIIINQGDFSHMLEVTDISTDTGDASDGQLKLKDVFSGTTYEVSMVEDASGYFNGTKVIDGYEYYFWSHDASPDEVAVVWGDATAEAIATSAARDPGAVTTLFPTIIAAKDSEVAFLNNITIGQSEASKTYEIMGILVTLANDTQEITGTSINYTYEDATTGFLYIESVTEPAVAILEEKGEDIGNNDARNAVIVEASDNADGITIDTGGSTPVFTDNLAAASWLDTSDSDINVAGDRYGVVVFQNTDDQGTVDVYYPDTQAIMAAGIGPSPVFSVSGEAGTVQVAYQITTPIAKTADEISTPATLNRDVILVGGPCVNALVATLMDTTMDWPACGEAADLAGLSEGVIKEYADAFGSGQKALVIAGKDGADTKALCTRALTDISDYSA